MQVSVETVSDLERRLKVGVPAERVESEVAAKLRETAKTARLPGFRPGKVPMKEIARRYGPGVRQEVVGQVIRETFLEAVEREKLRPAGQPNIVPQSIAAGRDLEFTATFEVLPEFELADLSGIKIARPKAKVADADIDEMIDVFRRQQGTWESVDRAPAEGDRVVVEIIDIRPEVQPKPEAEPAAGGDAKPEAEAGAGTEAETETRGEAEAGAGGEAGTGAGGDAETGAGDEPKAAAGGEIEAKAEGEAEAGVAGGAAGAAGTGAAAETETDAKAGPEAAASGAADAAAAAEAETEAEPEPAPPPKPPSERHELFFDARIAIEGLKKGVGKMRPGQEKTMKLRYPRDYAAPRLRGANAPFAVKLHAVRTLVPAPLNAAFFRAYGVEEGGEARFRQEVAENMERELRQAVRNRVRQQVMEALVAAHAGQALPKALVQGELDAMLQRLLGGAGGAAAGAGPGRGQAQAELARQRLLAGEAGARLREQAEWRARLALVLGRAVDAWGLKGDPAKVREAIEEIASTFEKPAEVVQWYYKTPELLTDVENMVLQDQVVAALLEKAKIREESCSYRDAIALGRGEEPGGKGKGWKGIGGRA